ncbi:MAG: hypothetical protein WD512_06735 [Candidatus Paceibacterota bacterium]
MELEIPTNFQSVSRLKKIPIEIEDEEDVEQEKYFNFFPIFFNFFSILTLLEPKQPWSSTVVRNSIRFLYFRQKRYGLVEQFALQRFEAPPDLKSEIGKMRNNLRGYCCTFYKQLATMFDEKKQAYTTVIGSPEEEKVCIN